VGRAVTVKNGNRTAQLNLSARQTTSLDGSLSPVWRVILKQS